MIKKLGKFFLCILGFFIIVSIIANFGNSKTEYPYTVEIKKLQPLVLNQQSYDSRYKCLCRNPDNPDTKTNWIMVRFEITGDSLILGDSTDEPLVYEGTTQEGYDVFLLKRSYIDKDAYTKIVLFDPKTNHVITKIISLKDGEIISFNGSVDEIK